MNKKVYSFLRRYFIDKDSNTFFSESLKEEDIKNFISKIYGISINKVERLELKKHNAIVFKFYGTYLHSGFTNIPFEGLFIAKDNMYKIETEVNIFSVNYLDRWAEFMIEKFGKKYKRKIKVEIKY